MRSFHRLALVAIAAPLFAATAHCGDSGDSSGTPAPSSSSAGDGGASTGSEGGSTTTPDGGVASTTNPLSSLPLIPWEGGPAYWEKFAVTKAAGWSDPKFFPIVIWYNGISSNDEAQFDKSYGVNGYIGMDDGTPYSLFADNGVFWLGGKLNSTFTATGSAWAGDFLDDEIDGRAASLSAALQTVKDDVKASGDDGRFKAFNFTQIVSGSYSTENDALSAQILTAYDGPVSVDNYWYTMPDCTGSPSFNYDLVKVDSAHCRTSSSYGKTVRSLHQRLAGTGQFKPIWNFIENLTGAPDAGHFYANITPAQLEGAAMASVIAEARGLLWFNQSLGGDCQTGSALRQAQVNSGFCGKTQMDAMKEIDNRLLALAPVINTQSYDYSFGENLDTMLKWQDGSAWIFAMPSGDASSQPGSRTFTLPPGIASAKSVTVVNESRTVAVTGGSFTDDFAAEYTYHVYQVTP
ncbi:MAG TPA: hypothetical protein VF407_09820 [Polyangiaceae bacterium]